MGNSYLDPMWPSSFDGPAYSMCIRVTCGGKMAAPGPWRTFNNYRGLLKHRDAEWFEACPSQGSRRSPFTFYITLVSHCAAVGRSSGARLAGSIELTAFSLCSRLITPGILRYVEVPLKQLYFQRLGKRKGMSLRAVPKFLGRGSSTLQSAAVPFLILSRGLSYPP